MDVPAQLRQLRKSILGAASDPAPFEIWQEVHPSLSREQSVQILTGWNQYLRTGNEDALRSAIDQVIRQLQS